MKQRLQVHVQLSHLITCGQAAAEGWLWRTTESGAVQSQNKGWLCNASHR